MCRLSAGARKRQCVGVDGSPYLESEHAEVVVDVFGMAQLVSGVRGAHHAVLSDSLCVANSSSQWVQTAEVMQQEIASLSGNTQRLRHFAPV